MSKIEVNAIEPQCGTTLTVGAAGTTVTVPSNVVKSNALQASDAGNIISQSGTAITLGATGDSINLASGATQSGFGRTGTVDWITTPKTATFSAVSGEGYFCNTTAGTFTVNLPAGVAGAIVSLADYAATWQTNNVTVTPNGTDKIGSVNDNATLSTQGQSVTFVYVDSTQGWINTMDSTSNVRANPPFLVATGGTVTTSGDCKIHTFTGPGSFCVSGVSACVANNVVSYLVVASGGGGRNSDGPGGGAGGFREGKSPVTPYTASPIVAPTGLTISSPGAITVTVGGGGAVVPTCESGTGGPNSIFSSITSTGGGAGILAPVSPNQPGNSGGSGSGGYAISGSGGAGNTPPVSPSQGNPGGSGGPGSPTYSPGGGGGSGGAGGNASPGGGGAGGVGVPTTISGSALSYGGGGGGGQDSSRGGSAGAASPCGTGGGTGAAGGANKGGGGGGGSNGGTGAGAGGSGIVIIRYKFQ